MGSSPHKPAPRQTPLGELGLIRRIQQLALRAGPTRRSAVQVGIGDDCAILRPRAGEEIVVTTDFSLEGRHFRRDWHSPQSVGHRALARGLSDIAAMGARPLAAFLSLALPRRIAQDTPWIDGFLGGLLTLASRTGVPLAGGDTSESPTDAILADIVLLGAVPQGRALRRAGARPGDRLFVTGALGGAAAQLAPLQRATRRPKSPPPTQASPSHPHFFPEPRLGVGQVLLRRNLATAAIDLSDGVSTDLDHLCEASGVCAEIDTAAIPLHPLLRDVDPQHALDFALNGGEDYELLFTARPRTRLPRALKGIAVTEIGRILACGRGRTRLAVSDARGKRRPLKPGGWEHLR